MSDQPSRVEAVVLLLTARQDFLPAPETWTGALQRRSTEHGPAPFRTVRCATCKGSGTLRGGWLCKDCGGRGTFAVDAYTEQPVDTDEATLPELLKTTVACSRCGGNDKQCSRCEGTGREPALFAGKADLTGGVKGKRGERTGDRGLDLLESGHAALRHPAQRALSKALRQLESENPPARWFVRYVLEMGEEKPECLMAPSRLLLEWAVVKLAAWMPENFVSPNPHDRLALPRVVEAAWRARRSQAEPGLAAGKGRRADGTAQKRLHAEIRAQYASGDWSIRALALRHGYSYDRVRGIVREKEAA